MKKFINTIATCLIAVVTLFIIFLGIEIYKNCHKNKIIKEYETTIIYKDSVYNSIVDSLNNEIRQDEELIQYYKNQVDSYEILVDSLYEDIDVYKIKLDRIKEYNRIAGQGNNITFLRGWINRVLNQ